MTMPSRLSPELYSRLAFARGDLLLIATDLAEADACAEARAEEMSAGWQQQHGVDHRLWRQDLAALVREAEHFGAQLDAYLGQHPQTYVPRTRPAAAVARLLDHQRFATAATQRQAGLIAPSSFNAADGTIDVVFTTGAAVARNDGAGVYLEVLDVTARAVRMGRLNAGAPFLNTHASATLANIIGAVVPASARIAGGQGLARIKLSVDPAHAGLVGNIRDGVIRNVSVGYLVHDFTVTDGGASGMPVKRVTDWEPLEISAVPIPADPGARVRHGF